MNDSSNKDDGARLDWQSGGDSGMNAVLAWHHHYITQRQQWTAAALAARGVRVDTRIQPGTGLLAIEGQEPGVVEEQRTMPPEILISASIINFGDKVTEGQLIDAVALPWFEILKELERDPQFLHQLDWRKVEELVAGAYKREGWPDVILTPRSGDRGRDIIVRKPGIGAVRFIDQVKAYAPGHRVNADEVRALNGCPDTGHKCVERDRDDYRHVRARGLRGVERVYAVPARAKGRAGPNRLAHGTAGRPHAVGHAVSKQATGGVVTNEEFGVFLDGLPPSAALGAPPYIGIDECVNSSVLGKAVVQLCNRDLASGSGPLWNQLRVRPNEELLYVLGGLPRSWPTDDLLDSKPVNHATWEDAKVVSYLLGHFHGYDRLVLLSENISAEVGGLHWLLRNNVKPVLAERHRQRFSLTVLFKDGKIDVAQYAARVVRFFEQGQFGFGYAERVL